MKRSEGIELGTNLSSEIFKDSGEIDRSTGTDSLGVLAGFEEASDTADGELEAGLGRPGDGFGGLGLASASLGTRRTHIGY